MAVTRAARFATGFLALSLVTACGSYGGVDTPPVFRVAGEVAKEAVGAVKSRRGGGGAATPAAPPSREELEKAGNPVLRVVIPARGSDAFLTISDDKGDVVTWTTKDGTTFSLRNGVLTQTRGLGPDLMSSEVPSVATLLRNGATYQRLYFFLGPDDRMGRRTYDCTVTVVGKDTIEIFARNHAITRVTEDCTRPQGSKITNDYWIEGQTVRQSSQWVSGPVGVAIFQRVVD
ncbi:MAG: YjbF family lipoprotein [Rhodobacterales bacterium]|nr:YjbF family lipoprotein [Rhodobacterales bacterium]